MKTFFSILLIFTAAFSLSADSPLTEPAEQAQKRYHQAVILANLSAILRNTATDFSSGV